jgi:hypothetical protein
MKLVQSSIDKSFVVMYNGKEYFINYLNSSAMVPSLLNRFHWEVFDENQEELDIYDLKNRTAEEKEQIRNNILLRDKLIEFCIQHFNDYCPDFKKDF